MNAVLKKIWLQVNYSGTYCTANTLLLISFQSLFIDLYKISQLYTIIHNSMLFSAIYAIYSYFFSFVIQGQYLLSKLILIPIFLSPILTQEFYSLSPIHSYCHPQLSHTNITPQKNLSNSYFLHPLLIIPLRLIMLIHL